MRLTSVLYVRQWLSKLHPPLPHTPRDSQQLLRILEGSFRKHLDEAHPSPVQRGTSTSPQSDIPLNSLESSSNATHHYFNTVLNNVLLAKQDGANTPKRSISSHATNTFETAAVHGNITVTLLRRCLGEYLRGFKNGERISDTDRLAQKVASWIYTSNSATRQLFLTTPEVLDLAVQVASVDKQEGIAWDWLKTLYERRVEGSGNEDHVALSDQQSLLVEDKLVSSLMGLSIRRKDLNDAAQQFVEACQYRTVSGRAATQTDKVSGPLPYIPMEHSWKRLVASIIHYRTKNGISEDLFDRALSYGLSWNLASDLSLECVKVYHPVSPSAIHLSHNLENPVAAAAFVLSQSKASKKSRKAVLTMILDGAQLSLEQGHRQHARLLLNFAHKHYADFLPPIPQKVHTSLDVQIHTAQGELRTHSYNFAWT